VASLLTKGRCHHAGRSSGMRPSVEHVFLGTIPTPQLMWKRKWYLVAIEPATWQHRASARGATTVTPLSSTYLCENKNGVAPCHLSNWLGSRKPVFLLIASPVPWNRSGSFIGNHDGGNGGRMASLLENCAFAVPASMVRRAGVHAPLHWDCFPADAPVLLQRLSSPRLLRLWLDIHRLGRSSSPSFNFGWLGTINEFEVGFRLSR